MRPALAAAVLLALAGCQLGSSGGLVVGEVLEPDPTNTPAPVASTSGFATWHAQPLRGHLLVAQNDGRVYAYDLFSGGRAALPASAGETPEDVWGTNGTLLWRFEAHASQLTLFSWPELSMVSTVTLPRGVLSRDLALSRDGHLVVCSWFNETDHQTAAQRQLAVFDTTTGDMVEHGSEQTVGYAEGRGYDWLPNGRYVYMVGKRVVTKLPRVAGNHVTELDALPPADMSALPSTDLAVSPDGLRVAVAWIENTWVANLDGTAVHRISHSEDVRTHNPSWSPDGAFVSLATGAADCGDPVVVLGAEANDETVDARNGVKVATAQSTAGTYLTACGGPVMWR